MAGGSGALDREVLENLRYLVHALPHERDLRTQTTYEELQSEIRDMPDDPNDIHELLCYFMEQCWHDPAVDFPALEQKWCCYMGFSKPT
jgi:hypothetical protein